MKVSAANNTFRRDYVGDGPDGEPVLIMTVFRRWPDGAVRLQWASELIHALPDPGQDTRHLGTVEPLWTLPHRRRAHVAWRARGR